MFPLLKRESLYQEKEMNCWAGKLGEKKKEFVGVLNNSQSNNEVSDLSYFVSAVPQEK